MTVGERIKLRREELGLSQNDLAKKMNVSRQAISKAELHDDNITTDKVTKFANALDCTESQLMGWDDSLFKPLDLSQINKKLKISSSLSDEEAEIVEAFRNLDDEAKRQIVLMLAFLKDQNNKK